MKPDFETLVNLKIRQIETTEEADRARVEAREAVIRRNKAEKLRLKASREWLDAYDSLDADLCEKVLVEVYRRTGKQ